MKDGLIKGLTWIKYANLTQVAICLLLTLSYFNLVNSEVWINLSQSPFYDTLYQIGFFFSISYLGLLSIYISYIKKLVPTVILGATLCILTLSFYGFNLFAFHEVFLGV